MGIPQQCAACIYMRKGMKRYLYDIDMKVAAFQRISDFDVIKIILSTLEIKVHLQYLEFTMFAKTENF